MRSNIRMKWHTPRTTREIAAGLVKLENEDNVDPNAPPELEPVRANNETRTALYREIAKIPSYMPSQNGEYGQEGRFSDTAVSERLAEREQEEAEDISRQKILKKKWNAIDDFIAAGATR